MSRDDEAPATREVDAAGLRLLQSEGFREVPGTLRAEWYDLGGQRVAYWRAIELAERDAAARANNLRNAPREG